MEGKRTKKSWLTFRQRWWNMKELKWFSAMLFVNMILSVQRVLNLSHENNTTHFQNKKNLLRSPIFFLSVFPSPMLFPLFFCLPDCVSSPLLYRTEDLDFACAFLTLLLAGWVQASYKIEVWQEYALMPYWQDRHFWFCFPDIFNFRKETWI